MERLYRRIGYYNGADAVELATGTADNIVQVMNQDLLTFNKVDNPDDGDWLDVESVPNVSYTEDRRYAVVIDVADRTLDIPLGELRSMEEELCDEFIDIYELVEPY